MAREDLQHLGNQSYIRVISSYRMHHTAQTLPYNEQGRAGQLRLGRVKLIPFGVNHAGTPTPWALYGQRIRTTSAAVRVNWAENGSRRISVRL